MTREEAKEEAISQLERISRNLASIGETVDYTEFAIEALEQTDVLNKIREEIESLEDGITSYHNDRPWVYKDEVLQIIDKYRKEQE